MARVEQTTINYEVTVWKDRTYQDEYVLATRMFVDERGTLYLFRETRTVAVYLESAWCSVREVQG